MSAMQPSAPSSPLPKKMTMLAARLAGQRVAENLQLDGPDRAYAQLEPLLKARTPFRYLDEIGHVIGHHPYSYEEIVDLLEVIAVEGTVGGWVVIGSALRTHLYERTEAVIDQCREMIVRADCWYGADILGERVPGPALVTQFDHSLQLLTVWREDVNHWVRRAVGVAVHFWAKRMGGVSTSEDHAAALLNFVSPLFSEWNMDAAKGIAWGLKTLGRHFPDLVADWVEMQAVEMGRKYRAVMVKKALVYVSNDQRTQVMERLKR